MFNQRMSKMTEVDPRFRKYRKLWYKEYRKYVLYYKTKYRWNDISESNWRVFKLIVRIHIRQIKEGVRK